MSIVIGLIVIWILCTIPFVMLGVPGEASAILGAIAGICVNVYLVSKSNNESSQQTTQRPPKRGGSSYSVSDSDDDDLEDLIMLDMMDGKLDGEFNFFDKD